MIPDTDQTVPEPALPDLTNRIALVTGASRGIGYFVAKQMAAAGAHVVAVARTVGGLEELDDAINAEHARTRFVRDGFSLIAFLFPGLWLLGKRLWFSGALALILQVLAITIARQPGLFFAGLALAVAVSMLVALEGPSLVAGDLERKDWTLDGIVVADDIDQLVGQLHIHRQVGIGTHEGHQIGRYVHAPEGGGR